MKFLAEYLLLPSGIIAVLAVVAVVCMSVPRFRRGSAVLLSLALLMYLVFGSGLTAFWMMSTLEYEYPPGQETVSDPVPDTIVVLTGYAKVNNLVPISSHVNASSGFRVLETARIYHRGQRQSVIISGNDEVPLIMKGLLSGLGVPDKRITTDTVSYNTHESAVHLREQLQGKRFYLVTSAGHMPRAMGVFLKQGLEPVPAPTDYLSSFSMRDSNILPNGQHLAISDLAVHEYLALIWYRLLDWL